MLEFPQKFNVKITLKNRVYYFYKLRFETKINSLDSLNKVMFYYNGYLSKKK